MALIFTYTEVLPYAYDMCFIFKNKIRIVGTVEL